MSEPSRIEAAHARVRGVKRSILIAAVCTFAAAMGLARVTHPGASSSAPSESSSSTSSSSDSGTLDDFFGESDDSAGEGDDSGGWIAPSTGAPQVRTQTS